MHVEEDKERKKEEEEEQDSMDGRAERLTMERAEQREEMGGVRVTFVQRESREMR